MILGGTPSEIAAAAKRSEKEDQALAKAELKTNAELDIVVPSPTPMRNNIKHKPGKNRPKPASQRELNSLGAAEVVVSGPRSTRSHKEPEALPKISPRPTRGSASAPVTPVPDRKPKPKRGKGVVDNLPSVYIRRSDRDKAEKTLRRSGPPAPYNGETTRKRKPTIETIDDEDAPVGKRPRREASVTPKNTSSGRVVKAKNKSASLHEVNDVSATTPRRQSAVVARKSAPEMIEKPKKKGGKPGPKSKTVPPPPSPPPEPIVVSDDDDDDDMKEIFPTVGPYQCEICQKITDTKQEFVDHIKKFHIDVVDEEVLRSLESDLRKSRKKAEMEAKKDGPNVTAKSAQKTPPTNKKPTPASKKSVKAATGPKSSPKKKLQTSKTPQKRSSASVEDRTCKICRSVISTDSPSDHMRHRQSKYCQKIAAEKGVGLEDPLASPTKKGLGKEETADELAQRTCQFCGKVLSRKSDLSGHYKTKTCIAKQYEREAQQEMITNGGLPVVKMNSIENPEQAVSNTPVVVENAEVDTGYNDEGSKGIAPADSPPSLPTSTTNEEKLSTVTKTEPSPVKANTQPDSPLDEQNQFMATSTSVDPPQGDWLGGPITTISDTLSPSSQQGLDPLAANGQSEPELFSTPTEILGGAVNNDGLITPAN